MVGGSCVVQISCWSREKIDFTEKHYKNDIIVKELQGDTTMWGGDSLMHLHSRIHVFSDKQIWQKYATQYECVS